MEKDNSLTNKAYETIRQQIFDFDLFPGQIVSDYLLSKELNMSRTPIRQALMRLKNEGLLEEQIGKMCIRDSQKPGFHGCICRSGTRYTAHQSA